MRSKEKAAKYINYMLPVHTMAHLGLVASVHTTAHPGFVASKHTTAHLDLKELRKITLL